VFGTDEQSRSSATWIVTDVGVGAVVSASAGGRADLVAASGQFSWPRAFSQMAARGQDSHVRYQLRCASRIRLRFPH
jgi:hypothetical protein